MWPPMEILKVQAQLLPTVLTESIYYVVILIRKKKKKKAGAISSQELYSFYVFTCRKMTCLQMYF